jgi:P-type Ca2+ transporter type 2B
VFAGPQVIPEVADDFDKLFFTDSDNPYIEDNELWRVKYSNADLNMVVNGRLMDINGVDKMYKPVSLEYNVPSRHFTAIFNVFVMM